MPSPHVPKSLFAADALEYLRHVEATGDPLIITDNGHPILEVRCIQTDRRSPLERLRGSVIRYDAPLEPVAEEDWDVQP